MQVRASGKGDREVALLPDWIALSVDSGTPAKTIRRLLAVAAIFWRTSIWANAFLPERGVTKTDPSTSLLLLRSG